MKAKHVNKASRFVALEPGFTLHVRDEGVRTGRTLVLIHGGGSSLHTWEPWVARLGPIHRVITFDLPGHGLTGPHPNGRYTQQAFVDTTFELMSRLGVERATVGGNSVGGGVAWMMAVQHPERLDGLLLLDAVGSPAGPVRSTLSRVARMPVLGGLLSVITPRWLADSGLKTMYHDRSLVRDPMVERYWELNRYPGNRDATLRRFSAASENLPATSERLSQIKLPTLVLWGENDSAIPLEAGRWFARVIPRARLIVYPNTGHLPMEETPDRSAADVLAWLETL